MAKRHRGRGPYLLGKIDTSKYTIDEFRNHLFSLHFEKSRLAFKEPGEVLNVRLVDGLRFQWHVRVFEDGEVRGHYELSPEAHPFKHLKEAYKKEIDDKNFLLSLFGGYLNE